MRSLLLTVDYEIFGNGTGDPREHIIAPTDRMARLCRKHGVPLTVYFEVEEYLAFQRERTTLTALLGYDPAAEIRAQIIRLAREGHDIQLHLHPEWIGCQLENGRWQLHPQHASIDAAIKSEDDAVRLIRDRKAVIDEMLVEAGSSQRVTSYRAGAFCAQPGRRLLHALAANGFVSDSSAVKGMMRQDARAQLNFTSAPAHRRHWPVLDDVAVENPAGPIEEIPIYSRMGRRYQQLTAKRLLAKFAGHVPKEKQKEMVEQLRMGRNPATIARFLMQQFPIKLDFHNMNASEMLRWVRRAPAAPTGDLDLIVLIGHTKEHRDDTDFDRFLSAVRSDPRLEIISMTEVSARLQARRQQHAATARSVVGSAA